MYRPIEICWEEVNEPDELNTQFFDVVAGYPAKEFVYDNRWTLLHPLHTCPLFTEYSYQQVIHDQPTVMKQNFTAKTWSEKIRRQL